LAELALELAPGAQKPALTRRRCQTPPGNGIEVRQPVVELAAGKIGAEPSDGVYRVAAGPHAITVHAPDGIAGRLIEIVLVLRRGREGAHGSRVASRATKPEGLELHVLGGRASSRVGIVAGNAPADVGEAGVVVRG
jgi:hypothetical protein